MQGIPQGKKMNRLVVNCKHYRNAVGSNAATFFGKLPDSNAFEGWEVIYAIGSYDLHIAMNMKNKIFYSQHVDPNNYGPFTGKISMDFLLESGIRGSLLNHSENRIPMELIRKTIDASSNSGLNLIVCAENMKEVREIAEMKPGIIAYEPPELIGGNISVSSEKPEIIEEAAGVCRDSGVELLAGAGIKTPFDVRRSIELGARGALVASGVVLSADPRFAINSLIKG